MGMLLHFTNGSPYDHHFIDHNKNHIEWIKHYFSISCTAQSLLYLYIEHQTLTSFKHKGLTLPELASLNLNYIYDHSTAQYKTSSGVCKKIM